MQHLHGVVMGLNAGQLLYVFVGSCNWPAYILISVVIYVWAAFTLFWSVYSVEHGFVMFLLCAIGVTSLMAGCSNDSLHPSMSSIFNTVMPIVNLFVDTIMPLLQVMLPFMTRSEKPSKQATAKLQHFWDDFCEVMGSLVDHEQEDVRLHGSRLSDDLQECVDLGAEANSEVRGWCIG